MKNNSTSNAVLIFAAIIACAALMTAPAAARAGQPEQASIAGRGYLLFGGRGLQLSELNGSLKKNGGYPGFTNPIFSYGAGGHVLINRLLIGGEGHALIEKNTAGRGRRAKLGGGYGVFNIGYVVYSEGGLDVYPFVGIGGGRIGLEIAGDQQASFEDIIAAPGRMSKLAAYGFILTFNLGADSLIRIGGGDGSGGGFVAGARVGFAWSTAEAEWEMPGLKVSGGPGIGFPGFYFTLLVGGGGGR